MLWTEVDQQVVHANTTEGGTGDVPTSQESGREQNKNESALLDKVISNGGDLENNAGGESITSTDASVGKETEQKTNENKDQPQSAQNNQTANEVKNDVKNVNSTDGTNQAATSTEEMLQKVLKLQH